MGSGESRSAPPPTEGVEVDVRVPRAFMLRLPSELDVAVYELRFQYRGFTWSRLARFREIDKLYKRVLPVLRELGLEATVVRPPKTFFRVTDRDFLERRRVDLEPCLRWIFASPELWARVPYVAEFAEVSPLSFCRALGRKVCSSARLSSLLPLRRESPFTENARQTLPLHSPHSLLCYVCASRRARKAGFRSGRTGDT